MFPTINLKETGINLRRIMDSFTSSFFIDKEIANSP